MEQATIEKVIALGGRWLVGWVAGRNHYEIFIIIIETSLLDKRKPAPILLHCIVIQDQKNEWAFWTSLEKFSGNGTKIPDTWCWVPGKCVASTSCCLLMANVLLFSILVSMLDRFNISTHFSSILFLAIEKKPRMTN